MIQLERFRKTTIPSNLTHTNLKQKKEITKHSSNPQLKRRYSSHLKISLLRLYLKLESVAEELKTLMHLRLY
jgi:hypothetical protein